MGGEQGATPSVPSDEVDGRLTFREFQTLMAKNHRAWRMSDMSDESLWPENDDRTFDPAEEFIGVGGRRVSRRTLLAAGGVDLSALELLRQVCI